MGPFIGGFITGACFGMLVIALLKAGGGDPPAFA